MYSNANITLYLYNNGAWDRKIIKDVFWDERKASNVLKSGMQNVDSVKIFIPYKNNEKLNITTGKDIIVKGSINYEVNTDSEQTIAESKKHLKDTYGFVTISSCDEKLYGSQNMQHYELSCK